MKKYFYLVALCFSVSLFSCSSDNDDDGGGGGQTVDPPKNVAISDLGTQSKTASWGDEVTISGSGFSSTASFYLVPEAATKASANTSVDVSKATKLTATATDASVKFTIPFIYNGGKFDLYQIEGEDEFKLITVYLTEERFPESMVGSLAYYNFTYNDKGKLTEVKMIDKDNTNNVTTFAFTFTGDELTAMSKVAESEYGRITQVSMDFKYEGSAVKLSWDHDGIEKESVLTLDGSGNLLSRTDTYTTLRFDFDTQTDITIPHTDAVTYQYDNNNNLIEYKAVFDNSLDEARRDTCLITMDGEKSFFPRKALPAWYLDMAFTDVFNPLGTHPVGITQNVKKYVLKQGGSGGGILPWGTRAVVGESEGVSFEIFYEEGETGKKYPTKINSELNISGVENPVIFSEINYKKK